MSDQTRSLLERIARTSSPLKRQLLMLAGITRELRRRGKPAPILIGGCALAYYTREVYFTADIDVAYPDRDALGEVLQELGFVVEGRYWVQHELKLVVEVPASSLHGEDAPLEIVEFEDGLECTIIGIEDLLIDRMNACKHWKSTSDCEMVELLAGQFAGEIDWEYLITRATLPDNTTANEFRALKERFVDNPPQKIQ
ncbi:MAG: nucleotidyltransferase family protein [Geobacteraceae bacterium]|nr:nucleotidyltransferase family protein [Geobacteraceae bacterium]